MVSDREFSPEKAYSIIRKYLDDPAAGDARRKAASAIAVPGAAALFLERVAEKCK
jgi:UDP-N-acetylglucosamine:LPS N-acetylglucosamine transferase